MRTLAVVLTLWGVVQQATISVDVRLQEIAATVRDKQGRIVDNLKAQDFVLEENGRKQTIAHFTQDSETPISLGILIDTSGSMAATLQAAVSAARALVYLMKKPQDEFVVMTFDSSLHAERDFTSDRARLERELAEVSVVPDGGTLLFESVIGALDRLKQSMNRKRALLLVTDGMPSTTARMEDARNGIYEREILIYTFGILSGSETPQRITIIPESTVDVAGRTVVLPQRTMVIAPSPSVASARKVLDLLATASGGQSLMLDPSKLRSDETVSRLIAFVQEMALELRGQYTLGYYPSGAIAAKPRINVRTVSGNYRVRVRSNQ